MLTAPGRPDLVDPGFPTAKASEVYGRRVSVEEAVNAKIEDVPVGGIVAVQRGVAPYRVLAHARNPKLAEGKVDPGGMPRDLPIVVRVRGILYLHDGHHRATAAKLRGEPTFRARVVDIAPSPLTLWANRRGKLARE